MAARQDLPRRSPAHGDLSAWRPPVHRDLSARASRRACGSRVSPC